MEPAELDYALPPERIAQEPLAERDAARMLVLERASGARHHAGVRSLPEWLAPGDLLVVNATRVEPARLRGRKLTGGSAEALLLGAVPGATRRHRALLRTRGRQRAGQKLVFRGEAGALEAEVVRVDEGGEVELAFAEGPDPFALGEMPLQVQLLAPGGDVIDEVTRN